MPTITNERPPVRCYRAYDRTADRTSFIYARSLEHAKGFYQRQHKVDPESVEWRDEGEVNEEADE